MRTFSLDARLNAVEEMVPNCGVVCDIGADHGRLGAHLLLCGRCERVVLLDISAPSLEKARRLIGRLGLEERASFLVGDGALPLTERVDVAVIAGMGGETIADIVQAGRERLHDALLVMQPNVGQRALRERLQSVGYRIVDERVARAAGRWYTIIAARSGDAAYDERELLIGPVLLERRDEQLVGYARFQARVAEKALLGARRGADPAADRIEWELNAWREVLGWPQA